MVTDAARSRPRWRRPTPGYDLKLYAEQGQDVQPEVWDPIRDFRMMKENTDNFFSLWRSGCPATAMWVHRLGAERAKRMLLTGDTITGTQAKE
ncbi:hypothetical protein [Amycolatopsis tolypomycina]|uniref:hypothetical protein n=1 Tax=Amycolatopsis tolypomycina TaxID=208445 RepID=UPI001FC9D1DE|nr:hypothetical protein [Amycolatopsis tolypomycina]